MSDLVETERSGLYRDTATNALVNVDKGALDKRRMERKNKKNLERRIDSIENDLSAIKGMLEKLTGTQ